MTQREEMEIDKEGRIILGADLRRMLGLDEGEVKLLGMSDYLELWALDRFETGVGADVEDFLDNLAPGEDPLALPIAPRGG
jgi:DNA-binding transcriptional regulator/RsmH inhibitor MraZ